MDNATSGKTFFSTKNIQISKFLNIFKEIRADMQFQASFGLIYN